MEITRYIVVQAIKKRDNTLVPIWDESVELQHTQECGNEIVLNKDFREKYFSVVECIYDLKSRKLSAGIEIDVYPTEKDSSFKKGETVLFEQNSKVLQETKIIDIVYEEYDLTIKKGKAFEQYEVKSYGLKDILADSIYAIKTWYPFYVLENGEKVKTTYKLYHKA